MVAIDVCLRSGRTTPLIPAEKENSGPKNGNELPAKTTHDRR
jgi:hypothetical protein